MGYWMMLLGMDKPRDPWGSRKELPAVPQEQLEKYQQLVDKAQDVQVLDWIALIQVLWLHELHVEFSEFDSFSFISTHLKSVYMICFIQILIHLVHVVPVWFAVTLQTCSLHINPNQMKQLDMTCLVNPNNWYLTIGWCPLITGTPLGPAVKDKSKAEAEDQHETAVGLLDGWLLGSRWFLITMDGLWEYRKGSTHGRVIYHDWCLLVCWNTVDW